LIDYHLNLICIDTQLHALLDQLLFALLGVKVETLAEAYVLLHFEFELHDLAFSSVGGLREDSASQEIIDELSGNFLQGLFSKLESVISELSKWHKLNVVPTLIFLELIRIQGCHVGI
jgi:hypothetical protein